MKKRKRVNWFKVIALILMIVEFGIALCIDKDMVRTDLNTWRLYVATIMCIPINAMFICIKKEVKYGKVKQTILL